MKKSRLFTLCLAVIMLIQGLTTISYASDTYEVDEYFRFLNPNSRMDADGSFEYDFYYAVNSNNFIALASEIYVYSYGHLYDAARDISYGTEDENYYYVIKLYHVGPVISYVVDSFMAPSNGEFAYGSFEVNEGDTYFIRICPHTNANVGTGIYYVGYGRVGNVSVIQE